MKEPLLIQNIAIYPGQKEVVKLPVGSLPSGNKIYVKTHIFRAQEEGPVVLVLAGVHGDEINGVEIVRQAIQSNLFARLRRGTVIAIPILNVYGFINFSREVPDGKDVNRSFPGNVNGSLASRVARILTKKILPYVDFGVDFHTGGRSHYNYPQIRFSRGDQNSEALAKTFAAPILLASTPIPKSLRKVALDLEKPILVYEGGENLRYDALAIKEGIEGLKRLLVAQNMLTIKTKHVSSQMYTKSSWLRAARAGMFQWKKDSGKQVAKGEEIGVINDPYGQIQMPILAPKDGLIIGHNNAPVVSQGDALFHIGQ